MTASRVAGNSSSGSGDDKAYIKPADAPAAAVAERITAVVAPLLATAVALVRVAAAVAAGRVLGTVRAAMEDAAPAVHEHRLGLWLQVPRAHLWRDHPHLRRCIVFLRWAAAMSIRGILSVSSRP